MQIITHSYSVQIALFPRPTRQMNYPGYMADGRLSETAA